MFLPFVCLRGDNQEQRVKPSTLQLCWRVSCFEMEVIGGDYRWSDEIECSFRERVPIFLSTWLLSVEEDYSF